MMSKSKYEYYKDPNVETFMTSVLEKVETVKPIFDLDQGYRYPHVENAIKADPDKANAFLENLVQAEILDKQLHDMELRCPTCNSPNVSVNYICPKCISSHIRKTILLEHNTCGYIGTVINFGEPLLCPRCGQQIKEGEYRDAGSIYECANCNQQIETPFIDHGCRKCGLKFSFENALYQPKYAYNPTKLTRVEMSQGIIYLGQVVNVFEEQGFIREPDTKVQGESGAEHVFDVAFTGCGMKAVVDVAYSMNPMNELELLKKYSKIRDIKTAMEKIEAYLLVLPGLDEDARAVVKSYEMNVVQGENPKIAIAMLNSMLIEKVANFKLEQEVKEQSLEVEPQEKKKGFSLLKKKDEPKKDESKPEAPTGTPASSPAEKQSKTASSTARIKRIRVRRPRQKPSQSKDAEKT
jgi:hypothetical protein